MNISPTSWRVPIASLSMAAALLGATTAEAVTVEVNLSTAGPIQIGDQFDVILSVAGWNAADGGIDSVAFFVDFDLAQFTFVTHNPLSDGTEFLSESSQGLGYTFSDDTDTNLTGFGRYIYGGSDSGDATAGSIGGLDGAGSLGRFTLEAVGLGTGSISAAANDVNQIFGDVSFSGITPTGGVTLESSSLDVVVPEPTPVILALMGVLMLISSRRRRNT